MADAGAPLRDLGNPPERWVDLMPRYAALQIEETRHVTEHVGDGVPDLRVAQLPARYEDLLRADLPFATDARPALERFAPTFASLCAELDAAGIDASIQHDDLHMNNVYDRDGELRILDWGDASVGHPFFSLFETFRFLEEVNGLVAGDRWFGRVREAYLEPWGSGHRATFDLAERVGGLAHAIAWIRQRGALPLSERPAFDEAFAVVLRIALDRAGVA
jgi:hypothetical protein